MGEGGEAPRAPPGAKAPSGAGGAHGFVKAGAGRKGEVERRRRCAATAVAVSQPLPKALAPTPKALLPKAPPPPLAPLTALRRCNGWPKKRASKALG